MIGEKFKNFVLLISLFLFWIILAGDFNFRQILSGIFVSIFSVVISEKIFDKIETKHVRVASFWRISWFLGIVIFEIFLAAYKHIIRVIKGDNIAEIFEVELNINDEFSVALISNAITLTPGTMTLRIYGSTITVLGFASSEDEIDEAKNTILNSFQKPFLGG